MKDHTPRPRMLGSFHQLVKGIMAKRKGRPTWGSVRFQLELMESRQMLSAAAFYAPAQTAGTVAVQLDPIANVTAGTPKEVTFGVPFTRGSVTAAQLANLRVLVGGTEIPAWVENLTPWRSIDDPAIDGKYVRVARIQIFYTFSQTVNPETITVQWGGPARTMSLSTYTDDRAAWHSVTSGSFVAGDNVEEPDVLPLLPAAYMAQGMLDAQQLPVPAAEAATRDNPSTMLSTVFPGYTELDYAEKNFFYTEVNQNGTPTLSTIDYKTSAGVETWLYDRPAAMYELYFRSGFAPALQEAIRATDFYYDHIDTSGNFTLKGVDAKYDYNESMAYTYWLLGDNTIASKIPTIVTAHSMNSQWSSGIGFWTERNLGYELMANEIYYEVYGSTTFVANGTTYNPKQKVQTMVANLVYDQNHPRDSNGNPVTNAVDGGLYHTGAQHDITEASSGTVMISSPWMSALLVDPMVRVYGVWEDNATIPDFIIRMGNFAKVAAKWDTAGALGGGTNRFPDYLMREDGTSDNREDTDVQHAMDVGSMEAWATYFDELRGTPDASLRKAANDLWATQDAQINGWTSTGSGFRVNPGRQYQWMYKNSSTFSWALTGTDAASAPGEFQFSNLTYSVMENQGTATITVNRAHGSSGAVAVNYATSNGTATAGSDYTATSGTLNFATGETSKTFTIPITNDGVTESKETVILTLSNPTGNASLDSPATATLSISDPSTPPGTLQFGSGYYVVNENTGTATITVNRTDGSTGAVTVHYATSNGTATTADYTSTSGTLSFATGETSKTFAVPINSDALIEFDETFNVTLSSPTGGASLGTTTQAFVEIIDDDIPQPGQFQFSAATYSVNETAGSATITVTRTNGSNVPASIDYRTSGGTATAGLDYTAITTGTLNFAVGDTSKTFNVTIADDTLVESPESIGLVLSNPGNNATLGSPTSATLTIISDDTVGPVAATWQQGINGYTGTQDAAISNQAGGNGSTDFTGTFVRALTSTSYSIEDILKFTNLGISTNATVINAQLTLTLDSWAALTFTGYYVNSVWSGVSTGGLGWLNRSTGNAWNTPGAVGQGTDVVSGKSFTFTTTASGGPQYKYITLDTAVVQSWVSNANADQGVVIVDGGSYGDIETSENATVSSRPILAITYNVPGSIQFSAPTYSVGEAGPTASVTVTRTGGTQGAVGASYATSNGTATAGSDYTATSGTVSFADGDYANKTITIPITQDTLVEGNETVNLTLTSPTGGASLGAQATALLTINDDDVAQPGVLAFSAPTYSVGEAGPTATITVSRTGGSNVAVGVHYATSNGSATAGSDYTATSGDLSFGVGDISKTFTIPITDDSSVEGDETVNLTLSSPTGGATLGAQTTAALTITDNDTALALAATDATKLEGQSGTTPFTFTVTRSGITTGSTTVNYAVTGSSGNPADATDFANATLPSGQVSFAAGDTSKTITVNVHADTDAELNEGFTVTLSGATGGAQITTPTATGTIQTDDQLWTGTASTNWDDGNNWATGTVPVPTDTATIGSGTPNAPTANGGITVAALMINGGTLTLNGGGSDANTSRVGALTFGGSPGAWSGKLDVNDNKLIIDNADSAAAAQTYANTVSQIKQGSNNGAWNGTGGIVSGQTLIDVGNDLPVTVGVVNNDDGSGNPIFFHDGSPGDLPKFAGQVVNGTAVLVRSTWFGDADLSGVVDAVDYSLFVGGVQSTGALTGWQWGDFDYSGTNDAVDYSLFAFGVQGQGQGQATGAALAATAASTTAAPATTTTTTTTASTSTDLTRAAAAYLSSRSAPHLASITGDNLTSLAPSGSTQSGAIDLPALLTLNNKDQGTTGTQLS